jgi:hypothetical protein
MRPQGFDLRPDESAYSLIGNHTGQDVCQGMLLRFGVEETMETRDQPKGESQDIKDQAEGKGNDPP